MCGKYYKYTVFQNFEFTPGLAFEKNSVVCYLPLKRYTIFTFIVIQN